MKSRNFLLRDNEISAAGFQKPPAKRSALIATFIDLYRELWVRNTISKHHFYLFLSKNALWQFFWFQNCPKILKIYEPSTDAKQKFQKPWHTKKNVGGFSARLQFDT
jgi:hypothetical protein